MSHKLVNNTYNKNFFSKRKQEKEKQDFGVTSTYIAMLSVITLLLLYYVWILNVNATSGDQIRQLGIQKEALLMEKELLDVKIADLESLNTILQDESLQENMEEIENPDYLVIRNGVNYVYNY